MRKPIDLDELLVRVKAILKREFKSDKIYIDKYMIDCNAKRVYLDNIPLPVTIKLLSYFYIISERGEVVPIDV